MHFREISRQGISFFGGEILLEILEYSVDTLHNAYTVPVYLHEWEKLSTNMNYSMDHKCMGKVHNFTFS